MRVGEDFIARYLQCTKSERDPRFKSSSARSVVYLKRLRLSRFISVGAAVSGRALQYGLHALFLDLLDNPSFYCCRVD